MKSEEIRKAIEDIKQVVRLVAMGGGFTEKLHNVISVLLKMEVQEQESEKVKRENKCWTCGQILEESDYFCQCKACQELQENGK